jgi:hypothetical protein
VCRCKTDINLNSEHSVVKVLMVFFNENKGTGKMESRNMLGSCVVNPWRLTFYRLLKVQFSCGNIFPFLPSSAKLIGDFF